MKKWLYLLLSITNVAFANNNGFTYLNQAINPACVALFNSSLVDFPYIQSVNVNACQHSNAAFQTTLTRPDGSYYFYYNNQNEQAGSYSYKVLGKTNNGIYIVATHSTGGGTLVASDLLLLRLVQSQQYIDSGNAQPQITPITELQLLGYITGGDRCLGDFITVKISGNVLHITQYHGSNPTDCSKTKAYSIDLTPTATPKHARQ